jgi:8-oxo-dGTP diphosphatase
MTTFSFNYFGSAIEAAPLGIDFVPDVHETLSSHCMPFTTDGKVVAVNIINRGIDIPGGHIDDNETALQAVQREAQEEAQISVKNPVLIDVWRLTSMNDQLGLLQKPYLLLYAADVTSMKDFVPNDEADERLILEPDDFIAKYFGDKQQAQVMVDSALAARAQL